MDIRKFLNAKPASNSAILDNDSIDIDHSDRPDSVSISEAEAENST